MTFDIEGGEDGGHGWRGRDDLHEIVYSYYVLQSTFSSTTIFLCFLFE